MSLFLRKYLSLLIAIWLPLFTGSALAASVTMQMTSDDCPPLLAKETRFHPSQSPSLHHHEMHQIDLLARGDDPASGQQNQQNTSCKDCSVCHFACGGYLATEALKMTEPLLSTQEYSVQSTRFISYTSPPQDPPPLSPVFSAGRVSL